MSDGTDGRFWCLGIAKGGPLDGSEIRVESAPFRPVWRLQLLLGCLEGDAAVTWHAYSGAHTQFVHEDLEGGPRGATEASPQAPSSPSSPRFDSSEHWELDENGERRTWWLGEAAGGPLDGGEIAIVAAPMIHPAEMLFRVCIGEDEASGQWHEYVETTTAYNVETGSTSRFVHRGVRDGGPEAPTNNA